MIENNRIQKGDRVSLPTKYGFFELIPFQEIENGLEHIALIKGTFRADEIILTRIHSACATGDLFGSLRCDCGEQLIRSMQMIEQAGSGIVLYLQQEGRGIGLMNKIKAYKLQEEGLDTVDANIHLGFAPDEREYKVGTEILQLLGINKVKLLTNNPEKINGLEQNGIQVVKRIPLTVNTNKHNITYLNTKQERMHHLLNNIVSES